MKIHICLLDRECREYGAPARIHLTLWRWHFGLALVPGARFLQLDLTPEQRAMRDAGVRWDWTQGPFRSRWLDVRRTSRQ